MSPLPFDFLKPPDLIRRPPIAPNTLRHRLHMLPLQIQPPRLQKIVVVDIGQFHPAASGVYFPEDLVLVLAPVVVEGALFSRAADAAGGYLGDVDVGVGGLGVLGYGEGDGGVGDGFAEEPGYALLSGGVRWEERWGTGRGARLPFGGYGRSHRRGFCSGGMLGVEEELGQEQQTNVHDPLRSCSVLSGGAAIVRSLKIE